MFTEDELKAKVQDGYIVESVEEMTQGYLKSLIVQLTVQADTELMSAPSYWMAARYAPSANTQVSAHAIIQDELAHANIAYRLLEDIGLVRAHIPTFLHDLDTAVLSGRIEGWTRGSGAAMPAQDV